MNQTAALLREILTGNPTSLLVWLMSPTARKAGFCIAAIILGCGLYGGTVGIWRAPLMGLYVGIKLPLLLFLTLACNGLLNGFLGALLGSGLSFRQSFLALLMSFAIMALILGSIAPVTFFLACNAPCADSENARLAHASYLLIHTLLIAYTGVIANLHLYRALKAFCTHERSAQVTLLSWLAGNAFVGAQFSWILRPFFGSPNLKVSFLRPDAMDGTFYGAVYRSSQTIMQSFDNSLHILIFAAITVALLIYLHLSLNHQKQYHE